MHSFLLIFLIAACLAKTAFTATSGSVNFGYYNKYTISSGGCLSSTSALITEIDSYNLGQCYQIIANGKTSYVVFSLRYDYGLLYEDTYFSNVCSGTPTVYTQALDTSRCTWSYSSSIPSDPATTSANTMWVTNNYYNNPTFCTAHGNPLYALKTQISISDTLHPTCVPDGTGKGFQMYYQTYTYPATAPTPVPSLSHSPTQAPTLSAKDMMYVYISLGVFVGIIILAIVLCWYCQCCCCAPVEIPTIGYQPVNQHPGMVGNPMYQPGFNQQPGFQPGFGQSQMGFGPPPVTA